MSRPKFLVDHDFNEHIVRGVERIEPAVEMVRVRDVGLAEAPDVKILEFAAAQGWLVISHDVNTMSATASQRVAEGSPMSGVILVHQRIPVRQAIEDLLLIWGSSEAEEWTSQIRFLPL